MQRETIYYVSDTKWFSHASGKYGTKYDALKAHLDYITASQDFRFGIGDKNVILNNSLIADKRVNSRIAFSLVFALPNDLDENEVKLWIDEIRRLLAMQNNMREEDIFIGYHESEGISGKGNKHLHIVGVNLDKNGKSIALGRGRNEIDKLNKSLQQLISAYGYAIRRDQNPIGHIGTRLRQDDELRKNYLAYIEMKQVYKETLRELQEKKKQEEERQKQEEERKREEARKKKQEWIERNLFILQDNMSKLGRRIAKYLATDETLNNLYKEFETKTKAEIKSLKETGKADVKGYNDIYMRLTKALQEAEKKEKEAGKKQQAQKPAVEKPNQPPKKTEEIKSQQNTEHKPQEKKPTPQPQTIIKPAQTQPQAQKPVEPPKQVTPKQELQPKTELKQEQKPQGKTEAKRSESKPQLKDEKPRIEETKTHQIETPARQIEVQRTEPDTRTEETSKEAEPIKEEKKERRYILLYEIEEDADWYWENYIVNDIDENTNVETYQLPERLTEDHMKRLKRIASKGHRIDLLISNEQYFYANYDVLDKLKDYINIMVIEKPEQGQRQKNQDREEKQGRGYHRPIM